MEKDPVRILLIEDDEDDYVLVRDLLSELPRFRFRLDWVATYEAGLEAICRREHNAYLLDYRLGEQNGLTLLKEAIRKGCEAPIILITGQGDYEVDLEAMRAGASDYLAKGQINGDLLERSIRYSIERKHSELELRKYHNHLEELVRERTAELEGANRKLQLEIAERGRVEKKVSEQNAFLNNVLESLTHPFYVIDAANYTVLMANSAASPDPLPPNTTCYLLTHQNIKPCGGPEHFCPLEAIKRTKQPFTVEHVHYTPYGEPRNVEVHSYPIFDPAGEVVQIIEYSLDITDRKRMEEALRKAHDELEIRVRERTRELAQANESLRGEIAERKRVEESLRLNESRLESLLELSQMRKASIHDITAFVLEQQVGLTRSEVGWLGFINEEETVLTLHSWSRAVMEECALAEDTVHLPIEAAGIWADAVRERKPVVINDYSASNPRKKGYPQGHVPLLRVMVLPVVDEGRVVAVAAVANKQKDYDTSDIRQLTLLMDGMWKLIRQEQSERALREAENLATLGRALSGLAHDMKTPLIAIGGFTRLVQKHIEKDHPYRGKLDIVIQETQRLEHMVQEMLDFSRPLRLERSEEDINRVVRDSLLLIETIARKRRVSVKNQPSEPSIPAFIDVSRMKQVLINLIMNAVQASPEGEAVVVRSYQKGANVVVDVTDRGCGIPNEKREAVFSPFFTTKKEGTGLGLPIVKKIVEAHQGYIKIMDNPERGLTFRIVLPLVKEDV